MNQHHHQSLGRGVILLIVGLVIWWLYRETSASADSNLLQDPWSDGYIPPNDPRRALLKSDPSIRPKKTCSGAIIVEAPFRPSQPTLTAWPQPSNIERQFPPADYPWLYRR